MPVEHPSDLVSKTLSIDPQEGMVSCERVSVRTVRTMMETADNPTKIVTGAESK
jgi:hypothetical protein